jgi:hypothetical protein
LLTIVYISVTQTTNRVFPPRRRRRSRLALLFRMPRPWICALKAPPLDPNLVRTEASPWVLFTLAATNIHAGPIGLQIPANHSFFQYQRLQLDDQDHRRDGNQTTQRHSTGATALISPIQKTDHNDWTTIKRLLRIGRNDIETTSMRSTPSIQTTFHNTGVHFGMLGIPRQIVSLRGLKMIVGHESYHQDTEDCPQGETARTRPGVLFPSFEHWSYQSQCTGVSPDCVFLAPNPQRIHGRISLTV